MKPVEIEVSIASLQAQLNNEIEKYNIAVDGNAGFDTRKQIREEMRRIGSEIIALKNRRLPSQRNS